MTQSTAREDFLAANSGTAPVREGFSLDTGRLTDWMSVHAEDFTGPLRIEEFKGGQSNLTYKLTTPQKCYVLRRKPPGKLLSNAHAVDREARVMSALAKVDFPVPHIYGVCLDEDVLGSWFYVMEMIEGRIFWDATFPEVPDSDRPAFFHAMNDTLAWLHSIQPEEIGLSDYGKPGSYLERQISRLGKQYLTDDAAGRNADMDVLLEWLSSSVPADEERRIVHGDFRCDNLIFHPTEPRIIAVLDWELSTLGDPIADFTYHALMYRMDPAIISGFAGADIKALNIPGESQYLSTYCLSSGRDEIPNYAYYVAFNLFRLAAIFHGIKGRVARGNAVNSEAARRAEAFPAIARMGREAMAHVQRSE